ncbi:MAG: hypothetical protein WCX31_12395 [Salinivirgaceae bacterium]|jgi:hypothetical protein
MRKLICLCLLGFTISSSSIAQEVKSEYKKLAQLYSQGKYESCLLKADNYTYKEDNAIDAEPYLYVAMCYYQLSISEDPIIKEDYKDGYKQALKYAAKFVKKDKEGKLYEENIEFINLLKVELNKEITTQFEKADYRKVIVAAKQLDKLNREPDYGLLYFTGINEIMSNNQSQGAKSMEQAKNKLQEMIKNQSITFNSDTKSWLISGFLKYSEFLINKGTLKEASDVLLFGFKLFPDDGYLKLQSNAVNQKINSTK